MDIRIYTLTHKRFETPLDPMYVPLQVGSALSADLGYLRDDAGDSISEQNCYFSELTGFYWIWKNDHSSDYVGTCHYRRYLINNQGMVLTKKEYEFLLQEYDIVTTKKEQLNNSYYYGFAANHNIQALDATGEVIKDLFPEYYPAFKSMVDGPYTYYCNMLVTSKALFDEYARWLFTIFFEVQRRIDLDTDEDAYHKRVFGFISEFLLTVWVAVRGLKVYECKVGVLGEKAETREMKERLAEFAGRCDIAGAKEYFLKIHQSRPDIMMEAADVTGELHLMLQIIATADEELRSTGTCMLAKEREIKRLFPLFARLNDIVFAYAKEGQAPIPAHNGIYLSEAALKIAVAILPDEHVDKAALLEELLRALEGGCQNGKSGINYEDYEPQKQV